MQRTCGWAGAHQASSRNGNELQVAAGRSMRTAAAQLVCAVRHRPADTPARTCCTAAASSRTLPAPRMKALAAGASSIGGRRSCSRLWAWDEVGRLCQPVARVPAVIPRRPPAPERSCRLESAGQARRASASIPPALSPDTRTAAAAGACGRAPWPGCPAATAPPRWLCRAAGRRAGEVSRQRLKRAHVCGLCLDGPQKQRQHQACRQQATPRRCGAPACRPRSGGSAPRRPGAAGR